MSRYLCDARVYDVGSFTDELKVYRVVIPVDPAVAALCDCPANRFHPGRDCKHIGEVNFLNEVSGGPAPSQALVEAESAEELIPGYQVEGGIVAALADSFESGMRLGMKLKRAEAARVATR